MLRAFDSIFLKFMTGCFFSVVVLSFSLASCKQSLAKKNEEIVQKAMPEMLVQKDSLVVAFQGVKQEFEALKSKVAQVPATILEQPENAKLSNQIKTIIAKSGTLDEKIPQIEAKLEALKRMNMDAPSETVEQEIAVLKELLQMQKGRTNNYLEFYKKLAVQLDSIQKTPK